MISFIIKGRNWNRGAHTGRPCGKTEFCCYQPRKYQELERGVEQNLPWCPPREHGPTDTWISDVDLRRGSQMWISDVESCEIINFCCLSCSVYGTLLRWSWETNTGVMMLSISSDESLKMHSFLVLWDVFYIFF